MKRFCERMLDKGFTLVELLVVIAIISILFTILLPALSTAKGKAHQISCSGNIKQIHLACLAYADDYAGYMPPTDQNSAYGIDRYNLNWTGVIHPYLNGKRYDGGGPNTSKALYCPAGMSQCAVYLDKPLTNYMYSNYLGFYDTTWGAPANSLYAAHRLATCPQPSVFAIMVDGRCKALNRTFYEFSSNATAASYADLRHSYGINQLFVDGHIEWSRIMSCSDSVIANNYFWRSQWRP